MTAAKSRGVLDILQLGFKSIQHKLRIVLITPPSPARQLARYPAQCRHLGRFRVHASGDENRQRTRAAQENLGLGKKSAIADSQKFAVATLREICAPRPARLAAPIFCQKRDD